MSNSEIGRARRAAGWLMDGELSKIMCLHCKSVKLDKHSFTGCTKSLAWCKKHQWGTLIFSTCKDFENENDDE